MAGRTPGSTQQGKHTGKHSVPAPTGTAHTDTAGARDDDSLHKTNVVTRIVVVYDAKSSRGTLYGVDGTGNLALKSDVVVGGDGHTTPAGSFHASYWEHDHTSTKYGHLADTPWSKSFWGGNAFGPYQLHIRELENRGIYIHGTMGPRFNPSTELNALVSPTSHGCVRMNNVDNIRLHDLLPKPNGVPVVISTNPADAPGAHH